MNKVRNLGLLTLILGVVLYAAGTLVMRDTLEPFTDQDAARLQELQSTPALRGDIAAIEESTALIRKGTPDMGH
jgi:hypothetical protein